MGAKPDLLLFDLDGTLVDTAPDMAGALNRVLREQGHAPLPFARIRPHVSNGALALLRLGFGERLPAERLEHLRQRFLHVYRRIVAHESRPFDGIPEILETARARGRSWGVVTNKPGWLTEPLLRQLGLLHQAACVVSGDTLSERKPHPAPILHACRLSGRSPAETIYIGDAERDVAAGRAAGTRTLVAAYGYIDASVDVGRWRADGIIDQPADLDAWC